MVSLMEFRERTLDAIEKLYAETICPNFHTYMDFWNTFVGGKHDEETGTIIHYDLEFPATFKEDKNKFHETIENIFQANYTIFTNLAGSHFQLNSLIKSLELEITDPERHFLHWETFESAYIHLGNIRYLLDRIWGLFRRLDPTLKRREIFDYLLDAEKQEFKSLYLSEKDVNGKDCSILNLRNNFVHSSRIASINIKDFYYVPINLEKNVIWRTQLDCTTYDRTDIKLGEDIKRVELLLNKVEQIFSVLLKQYLDKNGIRVIKNGG